MSSATAERRLEAGDPDQRPSRGLEGLAQALVSWTRQQSHDQGEMRKVLSGLGILGNFLKVVSESDIDVELGLVRNNGKSQRGCCE
jgi:hypothetical protein